LDDLDQEEEIQGEDKSEDVVEKSEEA